MNGYMQCSECNKLKVADEFIAIMEYRNSRGNKVQCKKCSNRIRSEKRWLREKTTRKIRWRIKRKFKITCNMAYYPDDYMRKLNLEAIRAVYRLWCKTGRLIKYVEKPPKRQYSIIKTKDKYEFM